MGIVVDDSIIIAENMHRHFKMKRHFKQAAIYAINEVGNPTILATFTVIAAILPYGICFRYDGALYEPMPYWGLNRHDPLLVCSLDHYPLFGLPFLLREKDSQHEKRKRVETSWIFKLYKKSNSL